MSIIAASGSDDLAAARRLKRFADQELSTYFFAASPVMTRRPTTPTSSLGPLKVVDLKAKYQPTSTVPSS
jgi:hypothetical protein